jgi:uncharacterized membrane protein required for colicin V production
MSPRLGRETLASKSRISSPPFIQVATRRLPIPSIRRTIFNEEFATEDESSNKTPCRGRFLKGIAMGLDLGLGVIILIAAFRGWFQGFMSQIVRLGALVASVYAAVRVRDSAKPYVVPYLTTIQSDVIDRLLWWVAAVVTYLAIVGVAMLIIKMTKRPEIPGISQSGRNDQFAGFFLGASKGLLITAFLAAGIQNYGLEQAKNVAWAEEQAKTSWALKWNATYQPARRIWSSRPVRHIVEHVHRMGIQRPGDPSDDPAEGEDESLLRTASRPIESAGAGHDRAAPAAESSERSPSSSASPAVEAGESARGKASNRTQDEGKSSAERAN